LIYNGRNRSTLHDIETLERLRCSTYVPGPVDNSKIWKEEAYEQLLVALKDGDLHAQGRYSTTRSGAGWQSDMQWMQHSGYYSSIAREQWREGRINLRVPRLTVSEWEFIDIQFLRFMVRAIWPDYAPGGDVKETAEGTVYSPPYLGLMEEAIAYFHLSDANQEKKEALVEWFRGKRVEGHDLP